MPYNPPPRPTPPNGHGTCRRCHQPVIFCLNENGNTQAINPHRVPWGNQAVRQDGTGRWLVRQLGKDRTTLESNEALHYPHAPTCPNSAPRPTSTQGRQPSTKTRTGVRPVPWQR